MRSAATIVRAAALCVLLAVALAACLAAMPVPQALADGDPASDVLVSHSYFLPSDANATAARQRELAALLAEADRAGLHIRVAVIPTSYDLGSVQAVWRQPQRYADFLAFELSNSFHSALLVVMPNGFGVHWPGHGAGPVDQRLAQIAIAPGGSGLVSAALAGVRALAGSDRVALVGTSSTARSVPTIAIVITVAFVIVLVGGALLQRRLARRSTLAPVGAQLSPRPNRRLPARLVLVEGVALVVAVTAGAVLLATRNSGGTPSASQLANAPTAPFAFPAGRRPAPNFVLRDQNGDPVSLSAYRGRPVIVTFIDPLCRNLCPLAAHILNVVDHQLPPARRVPIIAVSVDIYADTRADMLLDVRRWSLVPQWHWAVGTPSQLAAVWKAYEVGVSVITRKAAGVTEHIVEHDEIAFVVDGKGYERALFGWPYNAAGVERTLAQVSRAGTDPPARPTS